jgi:thiol-disulfide isomerase/thioredoxin
LPAVALQVNRSSIFHIMSEEQAAASNVSISCMTVSGQTYTCDFEASAFPAATVSDLKQKVSVQVPTDASLLKVVFKGSILKDSESLSSKGISNGCKLHLVISKPSGAPPPAAAASAASPTEVAASSHSPSSSSAAASSAGTWAPSGTVHEVVGGESELRYILVHCAHAGRLCVVDWFAPWCGPCRNMAAEYASLAQQMPHVSFVKLSGEASPKNQQLFTSASISSFPTLHIYSNLSRVTSFSDANMARLRSSISAVAAPAPNAVLAMDAPSSGSLLERAAFACSRVHRGCSYTQFHDCLTLISKYIDNILKAPEDPKMRKIRKSNPHFVSKIASLGGHEQLMTTLGFESDVIDGDSVFIMTDAPAELALVRDRLLAALADEPATAAAAGSALP